MQSLMSDLPKKGELIEKKADFLTKLLPTLCLPAESGSAAAEFKILLTKSPTPNWHDKRLPQYTLGLKLQHLREKVLADPYITQELSCYIEPNGQSQTGVGQSCEPLYPWVERELLQGKPRCSCCRASPARVKARLTAISCEPSRQAPTWQAYRPGDPAPPVPMPLFIPLQSAQVNPQNLWDYYHRLPQISFTSTEIRLLQSDYHTVWIADGYDEIPDQAPSNVYDTNHLRDTQGRVKLIIGCRSQRVQALSEADNFVPHTHTGGPDWPHYRMRHVAPFTPQQTQDYIKKFVTQHHNDPDRPKDWDTAGYKKELVGFLNSKP